MPLLVGGTTYEQVTSVADFVKKYSHFKESAAKLCNKKVKKCQPEGLLYIYQREFATTTPQDAAVRVLGTEDATTCHMTVLRHTGSGAVCLSHCDGSGIENGVRSMVKEVSDLSKGREGLFELHIIGGFTDDKKCSENLSIELLDAFHKQAEELHLMTACITDLNDVVKNGVHWPVIYGVATDVQTGDIYPASFADKGPDIYCRSAGNMLGSQAMKNVYNCSKHQLQIGPFEYKPWPHAHMWLQQPDNIILKYLSTSPQVEPPDFVKDMRNTIQHVIENPHPEITLFPDKKPRVYEKDSTGIWTKVNP
uniref:Protein N-terminal asparagine amidohydrolase-like n=1 Tax=Saccoglossus kowalevskii TaxID=10224 RepID=A0ABM0MUN4_SACKO|nr:PREDICTED: protein N-terminal asparagine amidohydrolase-like [Saccoglossus kowalevskii]